MRSYFREAALDFIPSFSRSLRFKFAVALGQVLGWRRMSSSFLLRIPPFARRQHPSCPSFCSFSFRDDRAAHPASARTFLAPLFSASSALLGE